MPETDFNKYIDRLMASINEYEKKGTKTMKIEWNGLVIEGTADQVANAAGKLGIPLGDDGTWYKSQSRGLIHITDMSEEHLRRAVAKRFRTWAESLSGLTGTAFTQAVNKQGRDVTTNAMLVRLTEIAKDRALQNMGNSRSPLKW